MQGDGVEKDPMEACGYYRLGAKYGNVHCMVNLAFGFKDGSFGDENHAAAHFWFKRGALRGEEQCQKWAAFYDDQMGPAAGVLDQMVAKVERGEMACPY